MQLATKAARESAPAIGGVCSSTVEQRRGRRIEEVASYSGAYLVTREVGEEIARMSRIGMAMGAQGLQDGPEQRHGGASGGGGEGAGTAGCVAWR
ncbi:hypothetical protein Scep_016655 [Stephania cephalantha]|uniref:Uncharacterized protein n=1 Tax=Stephania cephalantha TaxID=152367 RepID=A0AAP0IPZ7_9MAGN